MKKKKLLQKILELEAANAKVKNKVDVPAVLSGDSRKIDMILSHVLNIKNELISVKKENEQLQLLVKQMSRSYKVLLDKVGCTQGQIGEIRQIVSKLDNNETNDQGITNSNPYATVYTDASMDHNIKSCGYGFVVVGDNDTVAEYSGLVEKPEGIKEVNINFGEVYSIIKALEILDSQYYSDVVVYTDNITAVNWADMGDQSSSEVGKWFYERLQKLKTYMNITILWMKRCTCVYNTRADELAKMAMAENAFVMVQNNVDNNEKEAKVLVLEAS